MEPDDRDAPAGASSLGDSDAVAWQALQLAGALQPARFAALLREGRTPREIWRALPAAKRPRPSVVREASARTAALGVRLLGWGTPHYPERLRPLSDAPPVLGVRGRVDALHRDAVAIVGSRAATAYGIGVARRLAASLAEAGLVVVSGLAYGIDVAAHRACLEAGGSTVAVQACGLDEVYPARHRRLARAIADTGAVVSEFPPGRRPRRAYFPLRNRLISGLARALVVVEARERSGSLSTARHAADQGVEVFAVPGPIDGPQHRGSNGLLRDGATPLLEPRDLLDALAWPRVPGASPPEAAVERDPLAARVLLQLAEAPADTDQLQAALGTGVEALLPVLLELELSARIERDRDGRWRRRA